MAIKVTLEPKEVQENFRDVENCIFCSTKTRYWSVEENTPCCQNCARNKNMEQLKAKLIRNQIN